jgi:hypothetical protein
VGNKRLEAYMNKLFLSIIAQITSKTQELGLLNSEDYGDLTIEEASLNSAKNGIDFLVFFLIKLYEGKPEFGDERIEHFDNFSPLDVFASVDESEGALKVLTDIINELK